MNISAKLFKLKEDLKNLDNLIIGIEGNIGAGKTNFIETVRHSSLDIEVVDEPWFEHKDMLEGFYNNPHYWAFPFQLAMLSRRAHNHFVMQKKKGSMLVERTLFADRYIFARAVNLEGYMTELQFRDYEMIFDDLSFFIKEPDIYIYLRAPLELLMNRIKQRNRKGEDKIKVEYLKLLENLYDDWLLPKKNTLVVDIDKDFSSVNWSEHPLFKDLEDLKRPTEINSLIPIEIVSTIKKNLKTSFGCTPECCYI